MDLEPTIPRPARVVGAWAWIIVGVGLALFVLGQAWAIASVVILPTFVALIIATIAIPPARRLQNLGVPPAAAAAIVVGGSLAAIVGTGFALAPSFIDQLSELTPTVRAGLDTILELLANFGYDEAALRDLLDQARETASSSSSAIISGLAGGLAVALQGVAGLALLIVLLFFFVKDAEQIAAWMVARTPPARREATIAIGRRAAEALGGYVRGTATIALVDAAAIGLGLALIGVPLVLPLTLLVFLGGFLPVIGAFIAGLVAVLVALASGGLVDAAIALAVVIGVQQLEGNVLQPMVMRRAVALHPVVVLAALALGASLAGIVGAFLSLPVAAVAAAVGNEVRLRADAIAADGTPASDTVPAAAANDAVDDDGN